MKITHESSTGEFKRLLDSSTQTENVPLLPLRRDFYSYNKKSPVAVVCTNNRKEGIEHALRLLGGIKKITDGVKGEILIKPNCNHDMPFPRNSHPKTVKIIAGSLIKAGFEPGNIVVGDMSGMYRGLPTRYTMENLGITKIAKEMGIAVSYFEEEEWINVEDTGNGAWPDGIRLPRRVYEAERIIMTPILRPHTSATFSMSMKLSVGQMDALGREWLHNGENFYEKLIEFNLAFSNDLTIIDGLQCFVDKGPNFNELRTPGIIIIGSNRVAVDSVAVGVLKYYQAYGLGKKPILDHTQIKLAEKLGLGSPKLKHIDLKTKNCVDDSEFDTLISLIKDDLKL